MAAEDWALRIHHRGAELARLSWDDLLRRPAQEQVFTLESIGNPPGGPWIGTAYWRGAALANLLPPLPPETSHLKLTGADGYQTCIPLEAAYEAGTLLAYEMNGGPLPLQQGYPVRLLVAGRYCQKMPRWLVEIEALAYPILGYWERYGWSDAALVKTKAAITFPADRARISGRVRLEGYAYAGMRGISAVEVRLNGGAWQAATLTPPPNPGAWTRWHYLWPSGAAGVYQIQARATDSEGYTQNEYLNPFRHEAQKAGDGRIHQILVEVLP
jgi:DMSO/TMAO reductase YedYZ molybdopterin-dependent catalytic subunit